MVLGEPRVVGAFLEEDQSIEGDLRVITQVQVAGVLAPTPVELVALDPRKHPDESQCLDHSDPHSHSLVGDTSRASDDLRL